MLNLSPEKINEIAEEIDSGFRCYIDRSTGNFISIPKDYDLDDTGAWDNDVKEIERNANKYLEIEPMSSKDTFNMMELFIDSIESGRKIKFELIEAIRKPKPFRHFRSVIDASATIRESWFDFKKKKLIDHVKRRLEMETL